jgi:glycosyltransferase involved in cell wall biosynthesis
VEDGISGYLIPPGRPELLAKAISKMLSDPAKMEAMGIAGYERVKRDFTFKTQTEKLEAIYYQVLNGHKGRREHCMAKS